MQQKVGYLKVPDQFGNWLKATILTLKQAIIANSETVVVFSNLSFMEIVF